MIFGKYAAAAGAVMLAVLWPFASGQIAQKLIEQQLDAFASSELKIENLSYERGYLTSEIETEFTTLSSSSDENMPSLRIKTLLNHGFLGVSGQSKIVMTEATQAVVNQFWSQAASSPITVTFDASVLGAFNFTASVLPIDSQLPQIKIKTADAVISGKIDANRRLEIKLDLPSGEMLGGNGAELSVNQLVGEIAGKMHDNLWIGEQSVKMANATLIGANLNLSLTELMAKSENSLDAIGQENNTDLRFNTINNLTSRELKLNNINFNDVALGVNLKNINHLALNKVFASIDDWQYIPSTPANFLFIDKMDELISLGAEVSIHPLTLTTLDGKISGEIRVGIESGVDNSSLNILGLIDQLSGNIDLVIPNALIEKMPHIAQYLPELVNKGFVVKEEENTHIKVVIVGDKLVSPDGNLFPLAWLLLMI